jgi:hypothetical protein
MGVGDDNRSVDEGTESFVDALAALKRRGSALLVVGAVPEDAYRTASAVMLGHDATTTRRRLLVTPNSSGQGIDDRLRMTGPVTPETAHVVSCADRARGVVAEADSTTEDPFASPATWVSPATGPGTKTVWSDGAFGELGAVISRSIGSFVDVSGGLEPAELRVAFDCLPSLIERFDEETLFRFLHLLTAQVRSVSGMIHVWLPQPRTDRLVRLFEPLFDAVVELRVNGDLTQRWEFRDSDVTSDWFEFEFDLN